MGGDENTREGFTYDELPSDLGSNVGTIEIESGKDIKGTFSGAQYTLYSGTDYSFKAYAKNSVGTSYGETLTFKTLGGPVYGPTVMDYDGNVYKTITIGNQTFTKENFHGTHYANGDPIPNVTDPITWGNLRTRAYCYFNNDPKIGEVYGGLYNFYVGADPRGLIVGWHVPTGLEWNDLSIFLNGASGMAGTKLMERGGLHWKNTKFPGTNYTGFTAMPNGFLGLESTTNKFEFSDLGSISVFWASELFAGYGCAADISADNCIFSTNILCILNQGFNLRLMKN